MKTGNYVGNDIANRFIPVGFTPRHIQIAAVDAVDGGPRLIWKNDEMAGKKALVIPAGAPSVQDPSVEIVPRGFQVSGAGAAGANEAAMPYVWTAWS